MVADLMAILASCAFDPNHPNAPCNDTPSPPFFEQPLLWVLVIVCVLVGIWLLRRRSRSG